MEGSRKLFDARGLPNGDCYDLPPSPYRFPGGAYSRIEIPSVEGPATLQTALDQAHQLGVTIQRISQGRDRDRHHPALGQ